MKPVSSKFDVFLECQALAASHGTSALASLLPEPEKAQPTLAYPRRIARQKPKEAFETWWSTSAPELYKILNLKATTGWPPGHRMRMPPSSNAAINLAIGRDFNKFAKLTKASSFFGKIVLATRRYRGRTRLRLLLLLLSFHFLSFSFATSYHYLSHSPMEGVAVISIGPGPPEGSLELLDL
ncbi:hypothetical protein FOVG_16906 [Fusarium oxysporum f. sp. pisi HDV247]|uniref:Uncharacterized protein n=1 Tax=Fusarium oxysporum f. sp. pisi HDV247 TaxID=1080344 RepID=W9NVT1_FUSOX|nr:hypothetical protein FOVG_16906 [Fusarium oxysporum f. sp. pisi HDV247]